MLTKAILRASDGAVGMDTREVQDICPNDGTTLRRVTWQEEAADANRVAMEQMKRVVQLETTIAQQREEIALLRSGVIEQMSKLALKDFGVERFCPHGNAPPSACPHCHPVK
jgi:hypothetical protein